MRNERIKQADLEELRILHYPDPRLREVCSPIDEVDGDVRRLVERMFELVAAARGVGLAAPQVGVPVRLFVAWPEADDADRRLYINPSIVSVDGAQEGDEGCLSFPGITCKIKRYDVVTIRATDLEGKEFEETARGLAARIFQHEMDHLNGVLIADKMSMVARLGNRRAIRDLQQQYADGQSDQAQPGA